MLGVVDVLEVMVAVRSLKLAQGRDNTGCECCGCGCVRVNFGVARGATRGATVSVGAWRGLRTEGVATSIRRVLRVDGACGGACGGAGFATGADADARDSLDDLERVETVDAAAVLVFLVVLQLDERSRRRISRPCTYGNSSDASG